MPLISSWMEPPERAKCEEKNQTNKRKRRDWEKYKITVTRSTFPCASWGTICLTNWFRLTGTLDLDGQVIGGLVQRPVYSGWVCLISETGKQRAADGNSNPFCLSHLSICLRPRSSFVLWRLFTVFKVTLTPWTPPHPRTQSVSSSDNKRSVKGERPERDKEGPYQGSTLNYLTLLSHHIACDSPVLFPNHLSNGTCFGPAKRFFLQPNVFFCQFVFKRSEVRQKKLHFGIILTIIP